MKFNIYTQISDQDNPNKQFYTFNYQENMFLTFTKNDKTLLIKKTGTTQKTIPLVAEVKDEDLQNARTSFVGFLVKKVEIKSTNTDLTGFNIDGDVQSQTALLPPNIPKAGNLPILFTLSLIKTAGTGNIQNSDITTATITLKLQKADYDSIPNSAKQNLRLYYKSVDTWSYSNLQCAPQADQSYLCVSTIQGFYDQYAVSAAENQQVVASK